MIQVTEPISNLEGVRIIDVMDDRRIWKGDRSEIFSTKSVFSALSKCEEVPGLDVIKRIWKVKVLIKVKVFAWLMSLGKLNSQDNFQRRRLFQMLSLSWCVLCKRDEESINHMFVHCSFSLRVWARVLSELNLVGVTPKSALELLGFGQGLYVDKIVKLSWEMASMAFCNFYLMLKLKYFPGLKEKKLSLCLKR